MIPVTLYVSCSRCPVSARFYGETLVESKNEAKFIGWDLVSNVCPICKDEEQIRLAKHRRGCDNRKSIEYH